jgi:RNA polymerase sigma factor (sigma-70 family)
MALPEGRQGRDEELRKRLYARFRRPLLAFFRKRVGDRAEAEDLTQDVFVRLIGAGSLDQIANADAYVFKIASNLLHDRNRRAMRRFGYQELPLDEALIDELVNEFVEERGPERVLLGREAFAAALRVLDELGERTRNIFVLSRLENMKQRDIATLYGIAPSTVEKHIMRALLHLALRIPPDRR